MTKVYIVEHYYDVDGGYGDAIPKSEGVAAFATREEADKLPIT